MSEKMNAAATAPAPEICEVKAQLESSYKRAKDAFDAARSVLRKKVGKSSHAKFLKLERATDLAWDRLEDAMREFATHIREHGCGVCQDILPIGKPVW
jgi:hypothetical protein